MPVLATVGRCRRVSSGTTGFSTASELPSATPALRGQPPHSGRPVPRRLLLHRRPHRSGDPHDRRGSSIASHQTLHVLRPRGRPCALQAKVDDIEKYRGVYDAGGTRSVGSATSVNSRWGSFRLTELPPRNAEAGHAVEAWDNLSDDERQIFARYMEIFAGMVDNIDQNLGRLRAHLEAMGEWDNTIIVFTSDNGGSREGQELGTSAYFRTLVSQTRQNSLDSVDLDLPNLGAMGGPTNLRTIRWGGRWCRARRSGSTRSTRTRAGIRCPSSFTGRPAFRPPVKCAPSTSTSPICCRRSPNSAGSRCRRPRAAVRYPNRPAHRWCRLSTTVASRPRIPSSTTSRSATALLSRRLVGGHLPSAP